MSDIEYIVVEEFDDEPDPEIRNARGRTSRSSAPSRRRTYHVPARRKHPSPAPYWPHGPIGQSYGQPAGQPTPSGQMVLVPPRPGRTDLPYMMVSQTAGTMGTENKQRAVKIEKIADGITLASDGLASLWPLPDQPPAPTGDEKVDTANQNEHRHAVASQQLSASRLRTVGRVIGGLLKLVFADDNRSNR